MINKYFMKVGKLHYPKIDNTVYSSLNISPEIIASTYENINLPLPIYTEHNKDSRIGWIKNVDLDEKGIKIKDYELNKYVDESKLKGMSFDGWIKFNEEDEEINAINLIGVSLTDVPACETCLINASNFIKMNYLNENKDENIKKDKGSNMVEKNIEIDVTGIESAVKSNLMPEIEAMIQETVNKGFEALKEAKEENIDEDEDNVKNIMTNLKTEILNEIKKSQKEFSSKIKQEMLEEIAAKNKAKKIQNFLNDLISKKVIKEEDLKKETEIAASNFSAYKELMNGKLELRKKELDMTGRQSSYMPITASSGKKLSPVEIENNVDFESWDE